MKDLNSLALEPGASEIVWSYCGVDTELQIVATRREGRDYCDFELIEVTPEGIRLFRMDIFDGKVATRIIRWFERMRTNS